MSTDCHCPEHPTMIPVGSVNMDLCLVSRQQQQDQSDFEKRLKALEEELLLTKKKAVYHLCEFYSFRNPQKKEGFELAHGDLLANASTLYPEAWAFLQTDEGKALCVTEDEWQAMTHATWATLADGTKVGFDGIGGAPFYVQDMNAGTLRLPDIRGMVAEASGFDGLTVGGVHGDMIRNITGEIGYKYDGCFTIINGTFVGTPSKSSAESVTGSNPGTWYKTTILDTSRVVPTGNANKPRAFGVLPCVYLGNSK